VPDDSRLLAGVEVVLSRARSRVPDASMRGPCKFSPPVVVAVPKREMPPQTASFSAIDFRNQIIRLIPKSQLNS
jgi:hypothetical protein